jgi:S-adenosylmethionine hydrolase
VAEPRPITFLSDYGYEDEFVGVCHAVISQIAPGVPVIDLTHGIARQDVMQGAVALANALPFCPPGVHLAVIDPGVGSPRRAADRLGGTTDAVDIGRSPFRLEPVSATFHGRDLFAPVAAHLALGARLIEAGQPIDPTSLAKLDLPIPEIGTDKVAAHAIHVDGYGNVTLNLDAAMLRDGPLRPDGVIQVRAPDGRFEALWAQTFSDVEPGELLLYEDSSGALALAANGGNASGLLDLRPGSPLELRPR